VAVVPLFVGFGIDRHGGDARPFDLNDDVGTAVWDSSRTVSRSTSFVARPSLDGITPFQRATLVAAIGLEEQEFGLQPSRDPYHRPLISEHITLHVRDVSATVIRDTVALASS
jgi:hypothetical protein